MSKFGSSQLSALLCHHADRQEYRQRVMGYMDEINSLLVPRHTEEAIILDLFAGCGGLALGFEAAGYKTIGFEMNEPAAMSYRHNLGSDCYAVKLDVGFDFPQADIVIGGPPCQPFSGGGNQRGIADARDGFPIFIDAVKRLYFNQTSFR